MARRVLALLAILALALVACGGAPAASPISDPKEILAQSVGSLTSVKTFTIKGTFGGSINAPQLGAIDLSKITFDAAVDIPNKKASLTLDAPSFLGTKVEAIAADTNVFYRITGPFAAMAGADTSGKFTKVAGSTGAVTADAGDPQKAIEQIRTGLNQLPKQPQKLNDEQCSGTDCYHVQLAFDANDIAALGSSAAASGTQLNGMKFDLWTRKNDLRPGKFAFSVDAGAQGNMTATFDVTYDQGVNISAPPADQVVEAPASS